MMALDITTAGMDNQAVPHMVPTEPSPLALCEGKDHRAVFGPWTGDDEERGRNCVCVDCGAAGRQSDNLRVGKGGRRK
jgi:hypothetical protein